MAIIIKLVMGAFASGVANESHHILPVQILQVGTFLMENLH